MARAGRKRQYRGDHLRQIIDAEKSAAMKQKAVVLAQPHRRGEESQLAGSALGRFILQHNLRREYFDAGEMWASTKRKWLSISGAPLPDRPGGTGGDVPMEVFDAWLQADADAMRIMEAAGGIDGLSAVRRLAMDDFDLPATLPALPAVKALAALSVHLGLLPASAASVHLPRR